MPLNITNSPANNTWIATVSLPDSGTSIIVTGATNPTGLNGNLDISFTGSPLTAPTPPASGSIYWIIELNTVTGALNLQQNTTGFNNIVNTAGSVTIFQQVLTPGQTDPALVPTDLTPDS